MCGRVCPHPCEEQCRRGKTEEPVNINHLKRFAADYEMHSGKRIQPFCMPKNEPQGGRGGRRARRSLTCAYYLARLGYAPTIYEAQPHLGGMLRYGIPEYRLPKKPSWTGRSTASWSWAVEAKTGMAMGKDFTLESLRQEGFEAIFMGVGCWSSRGMRVEGEDLNGVLARHGHAHRPGQPGRDPGGRPRVVVIGGGNTAMDCARTCWRLGAKEVTVLYRRTEKEMPANAIEIEEAKHEGHSSSISWPRPPS